MTSMTARNIWDQVLARIETKVNRHSFYTWFKPTRSSPTTGGASRVRVPNPLFRDWLTKHYSVVLAEALAEVERPGSPIAFVTEDVRAAAPPTRLAVVAATPPATKTPDDAASAA